MVDLLLLEELPAIILVLQIVRIKPILNVCSLYSKDGILGVVVTRGLTSIGWRHSSMLLVVCPLCFPSLFIFVLSILLSLLFALLHVS